MSPDLYTLSWAGSFIAWALFIWDWNPNPTRARIRFCICLGMMGFALGASVFGAQLLFRDWCDNLTGWQYFWLGCWTWGR